MVVGDLLTQMPILAVLGNLEEFLFDTLLEKHTTDELSWLLIVGHYKKKHIIIGTIIGILETGLMLFIFNMFIQCTI